LLSHNTEAAKVVVTDIYSEINVHSELVQQTSFKQSRSQLTPKKPSVPRGTPACTDYVMRPEKERAAAV